VAVYALQPPGMTRRRDEPLMEWDGLAKLVTEEAAGLGVPLALWGHCAGAALALEVARRLGTARRIFLAARLPDTVPALAREIATVAAAADSVLADELAAQGGLDGLTEADLAPADRALIGRAYRHDTRGADQYLLDAEDSWRGERLACPVTVVVSTSDPLRGLPGRYTGWGAFAERVDLAEVVGGGHYFLRTSARGDRRDVSRALDRHDADRPASTRCQRDLA
jgi:surfactin synthase thioesterase subunit